MDKMLLYILEKKPKTQMIFRKKVKKKKIKIFILIII